MSGWNQVLQNPHSYTLKKFLAQIIGTKVNNYNDLLARIGAHLVTENDIKMFADLANDIIAAGYMKAIDDYKKQLDGIGVAVNIKEDQSEKLGW